MSSFVFLVLRGTTFICTLTDRLTVLSHFVDIIVILFLTLNLQNLSEYDIKSLRISQESKR